MVTFFYGMDHRMRLEAFVWNQKLQRGGDSDVVDRIEIKCMQIVLFLLFLRQGIKGVN